MPHAVLEARPQPFLDSVFFWLMRRSMRRRFHAVLARGLEHLEQVQPGRSLLVCANHTNWWDGFVARLVGARIQQVTGKNGRYLMQEEANLRRYPFFRACGVFGIDLKKPSASLRYASKLLRSPSTQLWIFPQGALTHPAAPLEIRDGAAFLARLAGTQVLPLALRFEWFSESRPTILVDIGPPLTGATMTTQDLQHAMERQLRAPAQDMLRHSLEGYVPLLEPGISINRMWDYVLHRVQGKPAQTFQRSNS